MAERPTIAGKGEGPSREEVKSSIKCSTVEGAAGAASEGATEQYYVPYVLAAGAAATTVGWMLTLTQIALTFCYLKVPSIVRGIGSRKHAVLFLVLWDVITFLPFIILPFFARDHLIEAAILFFILSAVPGIIVGPIWASWMTDLVPAGVRGRYFGKRSGIAGASSLACFIVAGMVLEVYTDNIFTGFSIVFSFAAFARLVSWFLFWRMRDVPLVAKEEVSKFRIKDMREAVSHGSVGRFMVFSAFFHFSVFLAAPYFSVFMLSDLNFGYLTFMIIICAEQIARLVVMPFWGKYADAKGSLKVLRIAAFFIPLTPILWLVSQQLVFLIIVQVISGVVWAGFDLCSPNFIYGAAPNGSRIKYIALYRALNGGATAVGALAGGYLAIFLPPIFGYSMLSLFLLSGIARAIIAWRMLPPIVDTAHRLSTGLGLNFYKRRGLLTDDRVTDGLGWGLLHIPAIARKQLNNAYRSKYARPEHREAKREGMLHNKAWQLVRQKLMAKPAPPDNGQYDALRKLGMLRTLQSLRQPAGEPSGNTVGRPGKGNWVTRQGVFNTNLWQVLRDRLAGKNAASRSDGSGPEGQLDSGVSSLPRLQRLPAEKASRTASAGGALKREGLLHSKTWEAVRQGLDNARASVTATSTHAPIQIVALIHDARAWGAYLTGNQMATATVAVKPASGLSEGLLHNGRAWQKYLAGGVVGTSKGVAPDPPALARTGVIYSNVSLQEFVRSRTPQGERDMSGRLEHTASSTGLLYQAQSLHIITTGQNETSYNSTGRLEGSGHHPALAYDPDAWRRYGTATAPAEPIGSGKLEHHAYRPGLVQNADLWSRYAEHAARKASEVKGTPEPPRRSGLLHFPARHPAYLQ